MRRTSQLARMAYDRGGNNAYYHLVKRMVCKWLNRRKQNRIMSWEQFHDYLKRYPIPEPKIVHSFYTWSRA